MTPEQYERIGQPTIIALFFVVIAFMMLSAASLSELEAGNQAM